MRQNILGLFIGMLIAGVAPARAENSSVARIQTTPAALVRQALANNPELKFYAAEIGAAAGALTIVGTIKTAGSFQLVLTAPPGAGKNVVYDWMVHR